MSNIRYSKEHEWVRLEGKTATIGISNYAQEQLGDVVSVALPDVGKTRARGDEAAVVESSLVRPAYVLSTSVSHIGSALGGGWIVHSSGSRGGLAKALTNSGRAESNVAPPLTKPGRFGAVSSSVISLVWPCVPGTDVALDAVTVL